MKKKEIVVKEYSSLEESKIDSSLKVWSVHNVNNYKKGDILVGAIGNQIFAVEVEMSCHHYVKCVPFDLNSNKKYISTVVDVIATNLIDESNECEQCENTNLPLIPDKHEYDNCPVNLLNFHIMPIEDVNQVFEYFYDSDFDKYGYIKADTTSVLLDKAIYNNQIININAVINKKDSFLDSELMKLFTPIAVARLSYRLLGQVKGWQLTKILDRVIFFKISNPENWVEEFIVLSNAQILLGLDEVECYFDRPYKLIKDLNKTIPNKEGKRFPSLPVFFRCNHATGCWTSDSLNDKGCSLVSISSFFEYIYKFEPYNLIKDDKYKIGNFSRKEFKPYADGWFAYNTKNGLYYGWNYYLYIDDTQVFVVDLPFFKEFYYLVRKMKNIEEEIKSIEPIYYKKSFFSTYWLEDKYLLKFAFWAKESTMFGEFFMKVRRQLLIDYGFEDYLNKSKSPKDILKTLFKDMEFKFQPDFDSLSELEAYEYLLAVYELFTHNGYYEETISVITYGLNTLTPLDEDLILKIVSLPKEVYLLLLDRVKWLSNKDEFQEKLEKAYSKIFKQRF